jgi:copper chaperone CopZ
MSAPVRRIAVALALWAAASAAFACGHCVEDRIAAVYDHALSQRTLAAGHQIAYFAWDGPLARNEASRLQVLRVVETVSGVQPGGVRVSMEPAAIAVAFDPRRATAAAVAAALQKKLGALKLSSVPLQSSAK